MTAVADLISSADRERLTARLAELRQPFGLMRTGLMAVMPTAPTQTRPM